MFNDFHETTRNVGVFGMLLGLVLLAGLCGLGMAVFSGSSEPKEATLSNLIHDQEIHLRSLRAGLRERENDAELFEGYQDIQSDIAGMTLEIETEEARIVDTKDKIALAKRVIADEATKFNDYRSKYRRAVRLAAKGEEIDLSETKGEKYQSLKITEVTPLHLRVMKPTGSEGIPYQQLPLALQDRFQFSAEEAQAYRDFLAKNTAKRGQEMAAFEKRQQGARADQALREMEAEIIEMGKMARARLAQAELWENQADAEDENAQRFDIQASDARKRGRMGLSGSQAKKARDRAMKLRANAATARAEASRLEEAASSLQIKVVNEKRK